MYVTASWAVNHPWRTNLDLSHKSRVVSLGSDKVEIENPNPQLLPGVTFGPVTGIPGTELLGYCE